MVEAITLNRIDTRKGEYATGVGGPGVARLRSNHHRSTWLPLRRLPGSGGVVA